MSEFKASGFSDEFGSSGPDIVGLTTFTSPYYFVPPSGSTAERPSSPPPGMLRFNTDIGRLEVWRNDHWATILGESPNLDGGARGVFGGGNNPSVNTIDFITISTLGNASDFGDLTQARFRSAACSSSTRGVFGGGFVAPGYLNIIDYITLASTGNAADFGDLTQARELLTACSSSTRGVFGGGSDTDVSGSHANTIDFITIASTGNAVDFGDLTQVRFGTAACSSSTRGVFGGGQSPTVNTIEYITISSTGNALDFGDLTQARHYLAACSSSTRGVFSGGYVSPTLLSTIDFITIASTGNAQDFGELTQTRYLLTACSSSTRGVIGGGYSAPAALNTIEYITISSIGDAVDFGDLTQARIYPAACSNGHGGL